MLSDAFKYFIYLIVAQGISFFSILVPKSDKVLFFSKPDYSDNSKYLFTKMLELNLHKKLDLIWVVYANIDVKNVKRRTLKYLYHILTAKYIISTHDAPIWKSRNQTAIFTEHGMPFKATGHLAYGKYYNNSLKQRLSLYFISKKIDYLLSTSRLHAIILAATWRLSIDKILITGFPRQDALFDKKSEKNALKLNIKKDSFSKLILYAPTFRDWSNDDLSSNILHNKKLQQYLEQNNYLLIYKPHKNTKNKSNIKFNHKNIMLLENNDLLRKGLHLYDIFSVFNIVLTDYSSIFYETTLLDIPIIFYVPDMERYFMNRGFIFNPIKWLPGHIVKNIDEILYALDDCLKFDPYKQKRNFIKNVMFDKLNNCSVRVIDLIFNKYLES